MVSRVSPWDPGAWSIPQADDHSGLPLVSLGVLTYNRCHDLEVTLDVLFNAVQYPSYEIIVIDNGSSDGTIEMLKSRFPTVRLHEVGWNMGTAARNYQTELARGKYLFSYDDDSFAGTPSTVRRIVDFLERHPEVDVLNAMCYRPRTGIVETAGWEHFRYGGDALRGPEGIYLVEGGVCYRMSSLRAVEGFDPAMFYNMDGPEVAIQFYQRSKKIVLRSEFVTLHFPSSSNRSVAQAAYWRARHPVWFIAKHWPRSWVPCLCLVWITRRILGALLHPTLAYHSFRGLAAGFAGLGPFWGHRPKLTWKQALGLKRFYLQLFRW
jgi:GT2 family glycosyltransferase